MAVGSCGVGSSVENAERLDSINKAYDMEKPRFRLFTADTSRTVMVYEELRTNYPKAMDSIRDFLAEHPQADPSSVSYPVHPDSSVYAEIMFVDDRSWPDSVTVGVKVYNHLGESVTGLAPPYINMEEAKSRYWNKITDVSDDPDCRIRIFNASHYRVEEFRKNNSRNHAICYTLDCSGSMSGVSDTYEKLIRKMIISSRDGDMFAFVPFAGGSTAGQPLTSDLQLGKTLFEDNSYMDSIGLGTAVAQAIERSIIELSSAPDTLDKVIMLLTDAIDGVSEYEEEQILAKAAASDIKIYAMGYGQGLNISKLENYAAKTGGRFYYITNPREFKFAFADMYLDMASYYRVTFQPNPCRGRHSVSVAVQLDMLDGMSLTATGEYTKSYMPAPEKKISVSYLDIRFESGSSKISGNSDNLITELATELKRRQDIDIEIIGHTDDVGTEEANQKLSEDRARAVMDRLVELGVNASDITSSGDGENNPVASNKTEPGRAKNRRTELKITVK